MKSRKTGLLTGLYLIVLEMAFVGPLSDANAYVFYEGFCKWQEAYFGVDYFSESSFVTEVRFAREAWNNMPAAFFLRPVGSLNEAKIHVYDINDPRSPLGSGGGKCLLGTGTYVSGFVELNKARLPDRIEDIRILTATQEFGHAIGLRHSQVKYSAMWPDDANWWEYNVIVSVFDDIKGLVALYGWAYHTSFASIRTSGSASVSSISPPVTLQVLNPASETYAQAYREINVGGLNALPASGIASMTALITPLTLYRFHMGWLWGQDHTMHFATVELDNFGIKCVSGTYLKTFYAGAPRPGVQYFLELVVRMVNDNPNVVARLAYAFEAKMGNGDEVFLGSINTYFEGPDTFGPWTHAKYFDAAVWADSSTDPASYYRVDRFWNYHGVVSYDIKGAGGGSSGCGSEDIRVC